MYQIRLFALSAFAVAAVTACGTTTHWGACIMYTADARPPQAAN